MKTIQSVEISDVAYWWDLADLKKLQVFDTLGINILSGGKHLLEISNEIVENLSNLFDRTCVTQETTSKTNESYVKKKIKIH